MVPVSEVGAWTLGVADWVGVLEGVAFVLVCALGDAEMPVGLLEPPWAVAVAAAVVVTVAVVV